MRVHTQRSTFIPRADVEDQQVTMFDFALLRYDLEPLTDFIRRCFPENFSGLVH